MAARRRLSACRAPQVVQQVSLLCACQCGSRRLNRRLADASSTCSSRAGWPAGSDDGGPGSKSTTSPGSICAFFHISHLHLRSETSSPLVRRVSMGKHAIRYGISAAIGAIAARNPSHPGPCRSCQKRSRNRAGLQHHRHAAARLIYRGRRAPVSWPAVSSFRSVPLFVLLRNTSTLSRPRAKAAIVRARIGRVACYI